MESLSPQILLSPYQKLPQVNEIFLAYVVAIRDPLNLHLDIYWPSVVAERYCSAVHYDYTFISEELPEKIHTREAYSCHLKGVEIISPAANDFTNMKESYILISKKILRSGGWILVSIGDIDIYRRILVNIFGIISRKSINKALLDAVDSKTGCKIAKEYFRPLRHKKPFNPSTNSIPRDYHIIYKS